MEFQQKSKEEKKKIPFEEEKEGKKCPKCRSINDIEAHFCAECGYDFTEGRKCPKCGAKIIGLNADICEVCGEWLLKGKCKFCYAELEEGAFYCSECGNPADGIVCPQCGKLSYFDFCKFCNTPLTSNAQKMIEMAKKLPPEQVEKFASNQEARAYYMAQKYLMMSVEVKDIKNKEKADELLKLKKYLEKEEKKTKKKIPPLLFTEGQKQTILLSLGKVLEKEIQRQEEERRRQEERKRLEEEQKKREEERRRQEEERVKRKNPIGWHCNAFNAFHFNGPCECSDPSKGGHWETWEEFVKEAGGIQNIVWKPEIE